jgi:hypothetical protein
MLSKIKRHNIKNEWKKFYSRLQNEMEKSGLKLSEQEVNFFKNKSEQVENWEKNDEIWSCNSSSTSVSSQASVDISKQIINLEGKTIECIKGVADELKKMKETVESAARDVETTVHTASTDFEKDWQSATAGLDTVSYTPEVVYPEYALPKKKWRIKQGAAPQWYKARHGIRSKALSGAARVARFRPQRLG